MPETEVAEPQTESSQSEKREFGTPISEIFKQIMPYEHELEEQKEGKPTEKPVEQPQKEEKPKETVKETVTADVPGLPSEIFGGEPEKKTETAADEPELKPDPAPEGMKGKTKEHFEKLSTEKYEIAKKLRETERKIKELETKPAVDPELQARLQQTEAELKQYRERIYAADVTLDPKFEAQFTIPKQQSLERAKQAYAEAGGDPKEIEAAIASTGKARAEKLDEIYGTVTNKYLLTKLERAIDQVENIDGQVAQVMQNREAWLKQTQQERAANQHKFYEQRETEIKGHLDEAKKFLADEQGWEVLKPTTDPKFKWWNDQIAKIDEAAEHILLKTASQKEVAIAARMAATAPIYRAMFLQQKQRADKAEGQLKEYKQTDAGLGGEAQTSSGQAYDENESMLDAVLRRAHTGK